jgi:hypothetical protein
MSEIENVVVEEQGVVAEARQDKPEPSGMLRIPHKIDPRRRANRPSVDRQDRPMMSKAELLAAAALEHHEQREKALADLGRDAAGRLNRALHLAFTAWSVAEHGGRAAVFFGGDGDARLDLHVSDAIGIGGNGQSLHIVDEV